MMRSSYFAEVTRSVLQDCPNPAVVWTRRVTFPHIQQPCFAVGAQHLAKSQLSSCSMQESPVLSPTQLQVAFAELLQRKAHSCLGLAAVIVPCKACDLLPIHLSSQLWGTGEQLGWLFSQLFQAATWQPSVIALVGGLAATCGFSQGAWSKLSASKGGCVGSCLRCYRLQRWIDRL